MIFYFTYNDLPSGVYNSQVIDVCKYISSDLNKKIKLVALISIRKYFLNRQKIKRISPDAIVLPMFPKHENWKWNIISLFILLLFVGKKSIIARGPFAASLALSLRKFKLADKVAYDGRGAYSAEFHEYHVTKNAHLINEIESVERKAVLESDFRLAVSNQLVKYWNIRFGYDSIDHVVIPCTFSSKQDFSSFTEHDIKNARIKAGFSENDIVLVFSGSTAGWQSLNQVDILLNNQIMKNPDLKIVFLAQVELEKLLVYRNFPQKVTQKWIAPDLVYQSLLACDYGILIRDQTITNKVASPTKFAEYLLAGLKVLISKDLGDFSDFVSRNNCGNVVDNGEIQLKKVSFEEKVKCFNLASEFFSKNNYRSEYLKLISKLS